METLLYMVLPLHRSPYFLAMLGFAHHFTTPFRTTKAFENSNDKENEYPLHHNFFISYIGLNEVL